LTEETSVPKDKKEIKFVHLEPATILQINATIIAGLLILLTIGGSLLPSTTIDVNPTASGNQTVVKQYEADKALAQANLSIEEWTKLAITFSVVFPFILSSVFALLLNSKGKSIALMVVGYLWLMGVLVFLVSSNEYHALMQVKDAGEKFSQIPH
jgi:lipopolysaccharide export LptBFGC system permease protein LptF